MEILETMGLWELMHFIVEDTQRWFHLSVYLLPEPVVIPVMRTGMNDCMIMQSYEAKYWSKGQV